MSDLSNTAAHSTSSITDSSYLESEDHLEQHHLTSLGEEFSHSYGTRGDGDTSTQAPSRTFLIALDHSEFSYYAYEWAVENLINPKANDAVVLATVREPVLVPGAYGYIDFGDYLVEAEKQTRKHAHALIRKVGQDFLQRLELPADYKGPRVSVRGIVMRGDPRDELVRKAHELGVNALVVGSRGMGLLKRALVGSVSNFCFHNCHCPVIVVKRPPVVTHTSDKSN